VLAYAVFGGADFGVGFWDLTAGGAAGGRDARALIDHSLGPVWEANHTWLIYCLVVFWGAFPAPFAAIMSILYLPLGLAVLGIVLRGSGFAFRKVVVHTPHQRLNGAALAASSVITPFFLGTVSGGIASGRVPSQGGATPVGSWLNPMSLLAGALAVAHTDAPRLFHRLLGPALPLVIISALAGVLAQLTLPRLAPAWCGSSPAQRSARSGSAGAPPYTPPW